MPRKTGPKRMQTRGERGASSGKIGKITGKYIRNFTREMPEKQSAPRAKIKIERQITKLAARNALDELGITNERKRIAIHRAVQDYFRIRDRYGLDFAERSLAESLFSFLNERDTPTEEAFSRVREFLALFLPKCEKYKHQIEQIMERTAGNN